MKPGSVSRTGKLYRRHRRGPNGRVRRKRPRSGSRVFAFLMGLAFLGWVGFHAVERFPEYVGPLVVATSTRTVEGLVTHVRDGDTIEVEGIPIRFGSLDCPEMNTSAGKRAAARMRTLIAGEIVACHLNGRSSYERKIGSCRLSDGRDLGAVMMQEGLCRRFW